MADPFDALASGKSTRLGWSSTTPQPASEIPQRKSELMDRVDAARSDPHAEPTREYRHALDNYEDFDRRTRGVDTTPAHPDVNLPAPKKGK